MTVLPAGVGAARSALTRVFDAAERAGLRPRFTRRDGFEALCPVHGDQHPSLSVDWKATLKRGGRSGVVMRCRSHECASADVVAALGLTWRHLYDDYDATRETPAGRPSPPRLTGGAVAPASGTKAAKKPRAAGKLGPQVAEYPYTDEAGTVLGWACRHEPARSGKRKEIIWRRPGKNNRGRVIGRPDRLPLYNLPAVLAAITAGAPVYVVEGEKCADAVMTYLAEHGESGAATTCPNGAGHWDDPNAGDSHSRHLAGARVVILCDRDPQGYAHARDVRDKVTAAGGTVEAIRHTTLDEKGADVADHLAAGLAWTELADVPAELLIEPGQESRPERPRQDDDAADPSQPAAVELADLDAARRRRREFTGSAVPAAPVDDETSDGMPIIRDEFAVIDDSLCKITVAKSGNHAGERVARELLNARVRVRQLVRVDTGEENLHTSHVDLEAERNGETARLDAVPIDDFEKLTWIADLPWPDVAYARTHQGRSDVVNAIRRTSGPAVPVTTAYGRLGWHELTPGQWAYVHAGGAIGADGPVPGVRVVDIPDELGGYELPAPPVDRDETRSAFLASLRILDTLPPRLAAPLLGAAYRAALGPSKATMYVIGDYGAGKTGVASLALQHFMPAASWSNVPTGAGEAAATNVALEEWRHIAGDSIFLADDLAPDTGAARAASRADQLLRSQYNGFGKGRGKRDGGTRASRPPRGLLVLTGEDGGTGSAETRCIYLPVLTTDQLPPLLERLDADSPDAPMLRAQWTAAIVRHVAAGYATMREDMTELADTYAVMLRDPNADNAGLDARRAAMLADAMVGWDYALEVAHDAGAITDDERTRIRDRALAGLHAARETAAVAMSGRALHERAGDLVRSALVARNAYIEGASGGTPSSPSAMGYVRDEESMVDRWRPAPGARRIGWESPDGDRLWLDDHATHAAIEAAGRAASTPLGVTPRALGSALRSAGLTAVDGGGHPRRQTPAGRMRVWDVPMSWVYPHDEDDGPDEDTPPAPGPDVPPDDGGPLDLPSDHPDGPAATSEVSATPETASTAAESATDAIAKTPAARTSQPAAPKPQRGAQRRRMRLGDRGPAVSNDRFAASAVVVDDGHAVLIPSGDRISTPEFSDVAAVLAWAGGLRLGTAYAHAPAEDGQVWLMPAAAARLGLAEQPARGADHPAAGELRSAGWRLGKRGLSAWSTLWRDDDRSLRLVITSWLGAGDCELWATQDGRVTAPADAAELATRLTRFLRVLGHPWVVSGAVTGLSLLTTHTRSTLLPATAHDFPTGIRRLDLNELPYAWKRAPQPDEAGRAWVHAYDRHGAYLAASSGVSLGTCAPQHVDAPTFDRRESPPGLWRVRLPNWDHARLPNPFDPAPRRHTKGDGTGWVATPTLQLAHDLDLGMPEILEAYVYPSHHYALKPWYELLRDTRTATLDDDRAIVAAVKRTYVGGIGMLGAASMAGRPLHRPDWHRAIVAGARANLTRKLWLAAQDSEAWPLAIYEDCVLYASDDPNPHTAVPKGVTLGDRLGQWKVEGSAPMANVLDTLTNPRARATDVIGALKCDTMESDQQ